MTSWTKEQLEAIHKEGMPILVSAGAGSGKTAVLTERVLRKVKDGTPIHRLLILTFTKAAASEMKERIRKKLKEANLMEAAEQIDAAYITTFDSFALSIVKKYHYLLNVSKNVMIVDTSMVTLQKEKILDEIFDQLYEEKDTDFENLIARFCTKDDHEIKNDILNMHNKLDLKYDKLDYLNHYIQNEMNEAHFQKEIEMYMEIIQNQLEELSAHVEAIESIDYDYSVEVLSILQPLFKSETYDDIRKNVQITLPRIPVGNESLKQIKESLTSILKEIKRLTRWESVEKMTSDLESTKRDIQILIRILLQLEERLSTWKYQNDVFEFHDIAKLAIRVVKENVSIQAELKKTFHEILLDEYQDTSDLQEMFIELIQNQNVYMVGDMKQSIYRFRNANPTLFKEKYDNYRFSKGGIKIDLTENFRSRKEPLEDINQIFNRILLEKTGGVDYEKEHQMIFGNLTYEKQKIEQNMHMQLLTYETEENYTKGEMEAFLVAHDIQEKIKNHFQIMDPDTKKLRDVQYQDFVILMDRSTEFSLYKQIFEYENIPLTVHKDETITSGTELKLVYHILKCMQKMETHNFDIEWKYAFTSIMRSYLMEETDGYIFDCLQHGTYEKTRLYKHIQSLLNKKNHMNNEMLLQEIIEEFNFYQAFIKVGKVEERIIKMEYLIKMSENLSKMGYDCYEMMEYLKEIGDKNYEIRFHKNLETENSVNIMTIHKSKGLEYPICYYTGLFSKFNKSDVKECMTYDASIGFVIPTAGNGIQNTIRKELLRYIYQKQEIAEKIRLFYVALTRCREQIIMIMPCIDEEIPACNDIEPYQAFHFGSFYDMIKSIYGNLKDYENKVYMENNLTKDYKINTQLNQYTTNKEDTLVVHKAEVPTEAITEKTFSKKVQKTMNYKQYQNMEMGHTLHQILEYLDFEHPDYTNIPIFFQNKIKAFLTCPLFSDGIIHIYKEYEFYMETGKEQVHGIIDLMVEYENEIKIVDYKLKQITDNAYLEQLKGYQSYIESITEKRVTTYLYSILDETLEEVLAKSLDTVSV